MRLCKIRLDLNGLPVMTKGGLKFAPVLQCICQMAVGFSRIRCLMNCLLKNFDGFICPILGAEGISEIVEGSHIIWFYFNGFVKVFNGGINLTEIY